METGTEDAHKLLELLITKVIIVGKGKKATVKIPYESLKPDLGGDELIDLDLKISISVEWVE